ncbi:glycosyltransferase family 2 protein [Nostoc sp. C117]|uniref:glycosyltransferase family 2 protein n=1 Tax=Nostoc sp. C117 TaxID=3349875 RepID=UPI00370D8AA3
MTKIAILIPTFNNEDTLGYTLESIQSQEGWIEKVSSVYIADDCSTDDSVALAKKTWKGLIPLHIFPGEQNIGQWENVNHAINLIKETVDWLLILHSDDIAKPNWLEMMVSRIEACTENVGSICSSWDNLMFDGSIQEGEDNPNRGIEVIQGDEKSVKSTLIKGCWWHISGCAIRLKSFEDCGQFKQEFFYQADWEWLLRCLNCGWSIEYIPRTLILYRQNLASVSSKSFKSHLDISEFTEIIPNYVNLFKTPELLHLYWQRIKWIIIRAIKSLITLNIQRFLLALQVLILLLISLKNTKKAFS